MLARNAKGGYIWLAATVVAIVADTVLHGLTNRDILLAVLTVGFVLMMLRANRLEESVITRYQERAVVSKINMDFERRVTVLRSFARALWPFWFVLVVGSIESALSADLNLGRYVLVAMIVLAVLTIPMRAWLAFALFK